MNKELMGIVVCPVTHDRLRVEGERLVNVEWGITYPIRDGIPVMLCDEAELPDGIGSVRELRAKAKSRARQVVNHK